MKRICSVCFNLCSLLYFEHVHLPFTIFAAELAVEAVLRIRNNLNLEQIQVIKMPGGSLKDSFLEDGFVLQKKIGVGQPKSIKNAKILIANTPMDLDKIKIFGSRVRVDSMQKV